VKILFDIETDGLNPTVIHQLSTMDMSDNTTKSYNGDTLKDGYEYLRQATQLIGHNIIGFDLPVLERLAGLTFDGIEIVDTLVLSRLGNPDRPGGHGLAAWGATLGFPKVEHEDWSQWSPEMEKRCSVDVELNALVYHRLVGMSDAMPVAVKIEHDTATVVRDMCARGVAFDERGGQDFLDLLMTEKEAYEEQASDLLPSRYFKAGPVRVYKKAPNKANAMHGLVPAGVEWQPVTYRKLSLGSRTDLVLYLKSTYDWEPTQFTNTGQAQVNDEVLQGLPWPETQLMAKYFKAVKMIGYLNSERKENGRGGGWLHHVTSEGKLHANFISLRAVTGRPSCVAPNLQQVSTDPRARELFKPRSGWRMVGVDADGQELRCLGHYLSRYDDGEYGREVVEGDIHSRIQQLIGFETRNGTKPVEYGLIYGAGNPKLGMIALKDAMSVGKTLRTSIPNRGKQIRRAILEGITGFKQLLEDVKGKAKATGKLKGLDGRTLWVRSPHSALNLLLQSAGIIHMKKSISMVDGYLRNAGLKEDEDYGLILWVHDEMQFQARDEVAELVGKTVARCIEDAAVSLGFRVPMTGTYQIGDNWSQTH
jgi:hypothetical protein